jgi:hypothetical protein
MWFTATNFIARQNIRKERNLFHLSVTSRYCRWIGRRSLARPSVCNLVSRTRTYVTYLWNSILEFFTRDCPKRADFRRQSGKWQLMNSAALSHPLADLGEVLYGRSPRISNENRQASWEIGLAKDVLCLRAHIKLSIYSSHPIKKSSTEYTYENVLN